MQFKDAAYEILKRVGKPLHYSEITNRAMAANLLETAGQTPHASMGALLYTDTLKPESRFRRGDEKGTFTLKVTLLPGIQQQIETIQFKTRQEMRKHLLKIPPRKFEELIRSLLEEMGFDEAETTAYSNDKGVDVRGTLSTNQLSTVKIAIQAKRWPKNVGSEVVRNMRGSLRVANAEQGLIITPSDFTPEARAEAQAQGKTPISLINGGQLVDLLIRYQVGVKQEQYTVPIIDEEYWTEVLGFSFEKGGAETQEANGKKNKSKPSQVTFPLQIQATFKAKIFIAELTNMDGEVIFNDTHYPTPSTAAKVIATTWKQVNGWDFWRYHDKRSKRWEKIGKLRNS